MQHGEKVRVGITGKKILPAFSLDCRKAEIPLGWVEWWIFFHWSIHYYFLSPDNPIIPYLKPLPLCLEELFLEAFTTTFNVSLSLQPRRG